MDFPAKTNSADIEALPNPKARASTVYSQDAARSITQ